MCRLRQKVLHPSQRRRLPPTPSNFTPKFPTMPSRAYSICRVHLQLSTLCVRWKHKSNNLSIKPLVTKVRPVLGWPTAAVVSRVSRAPTRLCNPNPNHTPLFTHGNAVAGDSNPTGGWGYTLGVQWLQVTLAALGLCWHCVAPTVRINAPRGCQGRLARRKGDPPSLHLVAPSVG